MAKVLRGHRIKRASGKRKLFTYRAPASALVITGKPQTKTQLRRRIAKVNLASLHSSSKTGISVLVRADKVHKSR